MDTDPKDRIVMNTDPKNRQPDAPEEVVDELDEQHAIELPAREAFSLVFSSPTFLHAGVVIEQVAPDEPPAGIAPA